VLPEEYQIHKLVLLFCSTLYTCVFVEPYKKEMKKKNRGGEEEQERGGGKETDCFAIAWCYLSSALSGMERRQQCQRSSGCCGWCSLPLYESDVNN